MTWPVANHLQRLRLFLYVRKSSESSERQVQSIADQIAWGRQMEQQWGFTIVDVIDEEKSARKPGIRPKFYTTLERIEAGEADGLLAWQVNRLTRNPLDSGKLQWLLQTTVIQVIVTSERHYYPADNSLLLGIDTGMSTQYVRDLAANTWRGTKAKIDQGWFPSTAPTGYLNDPHGVQGKRRIFVDKQRWDTVRQIWDLMLTGTYNPRQIVRLINGTGFTTRHGKPLSYSGTYELLSNIFYTGQFVIRGQVYPGKHRAMITLSEFNRVQRILGDRGRPQPQAHEFAYTGLMRCGECGCAITAETKHRYIKATQTMTAYTYYRCTKTKGRCTQRTIRLEALEAQFSEILADVSVRPEMMSFVERLLQQAATQAARTQGQRRQQLKRQQATLEEALYNLQKTYVTGALDEDFYLTEKSMLKQQLAALAQLLTSESNRQPAWVDLTRDAFLFAARALNVFQFGDIRTKRQLITALATNYQLRDSQLSYDLRPWFHSIADQRREVLATYSQGLRTTTFGNLQIRLSTVCEILQSWYHLTSSIRSQLEVASDPMQPDPYVFLPHLGQPAGSTSQDFLAGWYAVQQANRLAAHSPQLNNRLSGRLSPNTVTELVTDYREGASSRKLASTYGISATSVKTLLRQQGATIRPRGHQAGKPSVSKKRNRRP